MLVDGDDMEEAVVSASLGIDYPVSFGNVDVATTLRIGYRLAVVDGAPTLDARFAGAPGLPFVVPIDHRGADAWTWRTGAVVWNNEHMSLTVEYDGRYYDDGSIAHGASAQLRYMF